MAFSVWLDKFLARIESLAIGHSGVVLWVAGFLVAGSIFTIPRIVIDTDVITFFVKDAPVRTDFFCSETACLPEPSPSIFLFQETKVGIFENPTHWKKFLGCSRSSKKFLVSPKFFLRSILFVW